MSPATKQHIDTVRQFGRTFTKHWGLLSERPYAPELSLIESRVLFELNRCGEALAKDLASEMSIDKGYLSRALASLMKKNILRVSVNPADRREKRLSLTAKGKKKFQEIDQASRVLTQKLLSGMGRLSSQAFVEHVAAAEVMLNPASLGPQDIVLRDLRPGDLGWVIYRHGEAYWQEYSWNQDFETLVGEIAVGFAKSRDLSCERAWIAEAGGLRLGCVFLVRENRETAKLRILLVEPFARGLGIGSRLVKECVKFAESCGYKKIVLWTNDVLTSARKIYEAEGFKLEKEEKHRSFGHDLVGQYWFKVLAEPAPKRRQSSKRAS